VLTEPVALPLDINRDRAVQQPVEDRRGHHLIGKDLAPGAPALVRRDDDRLSPVIPFGYDLEEERGLRAFQGGVADLIQDQQFRAYHRAEQIVEPIALDRLAQPPHQVVAGDEVDSVPGLQGPERQPDGQSGFPHPRRTEQQHVGPVFEETQRAQASDEVLVDGRLGIELEVTEFLMIGQPGKLERLARRS